jgi:hypothetical protein
MPRPSSLRIEFRARRTEVPLESGQSLHGAIGKPIRCIHVVLSEIETVKTHAKAVFDSKSDARE